MAKVCSQAAYLLAELVEGVKVAADAVWKGVFAEVKLHFGRIFPPQRVALRTLPGLPPCMRRG